VRDAHVELHVARTRADGLPRIVRHPEQARVSDLLLALTSRRVELDALRGCAHRDAGRGTRSEAGAEQPPGRDLVARPAQLDRHVGRHLRAVGVTRHHTLPPPSARLPRVVVQTHLGLRASTDSTRCIAAAISCVAMRPPFRDVQLSPTDRVLPRPATPGQDWRTLR
jgi:hypothetical protein